ncbi:hypothetical protein BGZ51_008819, partial [Haplosporangium sp. Z 767]
MAKVSHSLEQQVELLDIYHFLHGRKENLPMKLARSSFGPMIGVHLPRATVDRMLKREDELHAAANASPTGTHYIARRKNVLIEKVLNQWLHIQRKQNVSVNNKMIKNVCTVLVELQDDSDETVSP